MTISTKPRSAKSADLKPAPDRARAGSLKPGSKPTPAKINKKLAYNLETALKLGLKIRRRPTRKASTRARRRAKTPLPLSPGMLQIARLAAKGLNNAEIAKDRGVALQTINNTMSEIYKRLNLNEHAQPQPRSRLGSAIGTLGTLKPRPKATRSDRRNKAVLKTT